MSNIIIIIFVADVNHLLICKSNVWPDLGERDLLCTRPQEVTDESILRSDLYFVIFTSQKPQEMIVLMTMIANVITNIDCPQVDLGEGEPRTILSGLKKYVECGGSPGEHYADHAALLLYRHAEHNIQGAHMLNRIPEYVTTRAGLYIQSLKDVGGSLLQPRLWA